MQRITADFPQRIPCQCRKLDISDALAHYNGGFVCYKVLGVSVIAMNGGCGEWVPHERPGLNASRFLEKSRNWCGS